MIYFSKLIDICINRQESQKIVDNYFVGTIYQSLEVLVNQANEALFFYKSMQ